MKILLPLLFLAALLALPSHAERLESDVSLETEVRATPKFDTEIEAIDHYRTKILESKATSLAELLAALEIRSDSRTLKKTVDETDEKITRFWKEAGPMVGIRACVTPKLGDTIQRVGFLITYRHNIAFADLWLVNTSKGWHLADFRVQSGSSFMETLNAIPPEFFNSSSKPRGDGPSVEDMLAFSTIEPDKESGNFKETIILGNVRKDLKLTFGDTSVHEGEAIRYIRFPKGPKDFLDSIDIPDLDGGVSLKVFRIKADRAMNSPKK